MSYTESTRPPAGWKLEEGQIRRSLKFSSFREAMDFVNRVAELAEAADHHPDIFISYNRVTLSLFTHSEGKVTEKDHRLAEQINQLLEGQ